MRIAVAVSLAAATVVAAAVAVPALSRGPRAVSFARDVQPIFDRSCASCHPMSYPYLDLRQGHAWSQLVGVPAATDPAFARVLPGRPELSYLITHPPDPSNAMLLTAGDRELITRWIRAGAPDN
jgi:hypothetical protein